MQWAHRVAGALLFLLSAYVAYASLRLRYFTSLGPGPGFFPFWLAIILGLLSAVMVVRTFIADRDTAAASIIASRAGYLRMAAVVVSLVVMSLFLETLGFRLCMLAMYVFLLFTLGRHRPAVIALIALAGSFGAYGVFVHWLGVPLPVGVFGV